MYVLPRTTRASTMVLVTPLVETVSPLMASLPLAWPLVVKASEPPLTTSMEVLVARQVPPRRRVAASTAKPVVVV